MSSSCISLRDLSFRWQPDQPDVLDIAQLDVATGEKVMICGPSGSGKSTLLNLLGGVMLPNSGKILINGKDITALPPSARDTFRADHVGFIFQMFNLVPYLSPVDNVSLPCRFSSLRRRNALQRSGKIDDEARRLISHMNLDAADIDKKRATQLSVGQQQRIAAARALIGAPSLIIADEPTSSLDADATARFLDLLFSEIAAVGATLILVTHDNRLSAHFDRVIDLQSLAV